MQIEQLWEWMQGLDEPVQVLCQKEQSKPSRWLTVVGFTLRDKDAAQKREDEQYERIVGYFDKSCSLSDFREECEAQCEKVRRIEAFEATADAIFRPDGASSGDVGILPHEYFAPFMDDRQEWTPNPNDRYTSEYAAGWGSDSEPTEGTGTGDHREVRGVSECEGSDSGEPEEGRTPGDWFGYL